MLQQCRGRAERYNGYERSYGFPLSEYEQLQAAEETLTALKTLWSCVEAWDRMYDEWSNVNFEQLDVDDCQEKTDDIGRRVGRSESVLGGNPVSGDLSSRVSSMLSYLPCLKDLKAKSLKERHWKMISDVVGSDIKVHKVTLGFLEQNNVFNFAPNVVRIVRTAEMEEQLDGLIDNLRQSWSERKLPMAVRHGVPTVEDFGTVHHTIRDSLRTLRQLGSSQYSTEMRDQLLTWYGTVCDARRSVDVIKRAQTSWLEQDAPLTSMLFEDDNPMMASCFRNVRERISRDFRNLDKAKSLVEALGDQVLLRSFEDTLLMLEETAVCVPSALTAIRTGSPRLFFMADDDLLKMLNESYQDIWAMERYMPSVYPWFAGLILVEGTETKVTKRVYV